MQSESSVLRDQLVHEFIPDDVSLLGAQILLDARRPHFKSNESAEVITPYFKFFCQPWELRQSVLIVIVQAAAISATDDDAFLDLKDSQTKHDLLLCAENPNLLGVNQLLESVCYLFNIELLHWLCFG